MRGHSIVLRTGFAAVLALAAAPAAFAQNFVLQIGPPIAGNAPPAKGSMFVVRPGGCADPARAEITATAEGIVNGARRSVPLTLASLTTPGVHAVPKDWPNGGIWIVNVAGTCAGRTAGAIVSIGPRGSFHRDSVKLLARHPTPADLEASLKALTPGGQK